MDSKDEQLGGADFFCADGSARGESGTIAKERGGTARTGNCATLRSHVSGRRLELRKSARLWRGWGRASAGDLLGAAGAARCFGKAGPGVEPGMAAKTIRKN